MSGFLASTSNFLSVSENIDLQEPCGYKEIERNLCLCPDDTEEGRALNRRVEFVIVKM